MARNLSNDELKAQRRDQDKAMISDPTKWPNWPWLPVKRSIPHDVECALVHADQNGVPYPSNNTTKISVFMTGLYDVKHYFPTREMVGKAKVYDTLDAMLDDGWTVD